MESVMMLDWMEKRMMCGGGDEFDLPYKVSKVFTGNLSEAIQTPFKLFSNEMPKWILLFYAPDIPVSANAYNGALSNVYTENSISKGIWAYSGKGSNTTYSGIGCSIYLGSSTNKRFVLNKRTHEYVFVSNESSIYAHNGGYQQPVAVMRVNTQLFFYGLESEERTWHQIGSQTFPSTEQPLLIGASWGSNNTTIGEPYNSNNGVFDLELHVIDNYLEGEALRAAFFAKYE